jgi:hypothetical protein
MSRFHAPSRRTSLLAAALLVAGGGGAFAEGALRDARLLLDGRVRPGAWTAVQARVEADAAPLAVTLEARVGPTAYRRPVSLPARAVEAVLIPVFIPPSVPIPRVAFGGGPALEPSVTEVPAGELLVGVEPARAGGLGLPVREALAGGRAVHWVSLAWADVQKVPELLDALDGVVCAEPDPKAHPGLEPHLGAWLGRGGRLFGDVASARASAAEARGPRERPAEGAVPPAGDLLPRAGASPNRLHRGRVATGVLLILGAAAVALAGWRRLRPRAAVAAVAGTVVVSCGVVLLIVPAGGEIIRAAAVREILLPGGAGGRPVAESTEGFAAVETVGAGRAGILFPARTRVSVAAFRKGREAVIEPASGGCEASERLPAGGRQVFRFSRPGPAADGLRARVVRDGDRPVRLEYETGFEGALSGAVLVLRGAVYPLGDIPPQPAAGERKLAEGPVDWAAWVRQAGPPGDPRRALLEWWGMRRGDGAWLLATPPGDPPLALAGNGAGAEVEWGPVIVAVRIVE